MNQQQQAKQTKLDFDLAAISVLQQTADIYARIDKESELTLQARLARGERVTELDRRLAFISPLSYIKPFQLLPEAQVAPQQQEPEYDVMEVENQSCILELPKIPNFPFGQKVIPARGKICTNFFPLPNASTIAVVYPTVGQGWYPVAIMQKQDTQRYQQQSFFWLHSSEDMRGWIAYQWRAQYWKFEKLGQKRTMVLFDEKEFEGITMVTAKLALPLDTQANFTGASFVPPREVYEDSEYESILIPEHFLLLRVDEKNDEDPSIVQFCVEKNRIFGGMRGVEASGCKQVLEAMRRTGKADTWQIFSREADAQRWIDGIATKQVTVNQLYMEHTHNLRGFYKHTWALHIPRRNAPFLDLFTSFLHWMFLNEKEMMECHWKRWEGKYHQAFAPERPLGEISQDILQRVYLSAVQRLVRQYYGHTKFRQATSGQKIFRNFFVQADFLCEHKVKEGSCPCLVTLIGRKTEEGIFMVTGSKILEEQVRDFVTMYVGAQPGFKMQVTMNPAIPKSMDTQLKAYESVFTNSNLSIMRMCYGEDEIFVELNTMRQMSYDYRNLITQLFPNHYPWDGQELVKSDSSKDHVPELQEGKKMPVVPCSGLKFLGQVVPMRSELDRTHFENEVVGPYLALVENYKDVTEEECRGVSNGVVDGQVMPRPDPRELFPKLNAAEVLSVLEKPNEENEKRLIDRFTTLSAHRYTGVSGGVSDGHTSREIIIEPNDI